MDVTEADNIEYQDANMLRLGNELIHEYVRFYLKKYRHFKQVVVEEEALNLNARWFTASSLLICFSQADVGGDLWQAAMHTAAL